MKTFFLLAAIAASPDWALIAGSTTICAKSQSTCETALKAIQSGMWGRDLARLPLLCQPHPDCFAPASLCIQNYNCEGPKR